MQHFPNMIYDNFLKPLKIPGEKKSRKEIEITIILDRKLLERNKCPTDVSYTWVLANI